MQIQSIGGGGGGGLINGTAGGGGSGVVRGEQLEFGNADREGGWGRGNDDEDREEVKWEFEWNDEKQFEHQDYDEMDSD